MPKIILYSQPDCPPCEITKRFLTEYGFNFEVKDIKKDQNAKNDLIKKYNSYSTPTIVINDDTVIAGFDIQQLKDALHIDMD